MPKMFQEGLYYNECELITAIILVVNPIITHQFFYLFLFYFYFSFCKGLFSNVTLSLLMLA